jgi:glutaredoxin
MTKKAEREYRKMTISIKLYCPHCHSMKNAMGNKIIDARIADVSLSMSGN